jgi:hypothetical protein
VEHLDQQWGDIVASYKSSAVVRQGFYNSRNFAGEFI